jgi:hypothetical protein
MKLSPNILTLNNDKRKQIYITAFISILTAILLFLLRVNETQQTGDALYNGIAYNTGKLIYSPHHLLFVPMIRLFIFILSPLGLPSDFINAAQIHNILWAVISVLLFYATVRCLLRSSVVGLIAAIFLLFTHNFWIFSTTAEPYIPSFGCLAAVTVLVIFHHGRRLSIMQIIIISLLMSLSIFHQQTNVLFFIPLTCYLIGDSAERSRFAWLAILLLTGSIVLVVYVFIFLLIAGTWTFDGFVTFCLKYPLLAGTNWGDLRNFSIVGVGRMLISQMTAITYVSPRFKYLAGFVSALVYCILFFWNLWHVVRRDTHYKIRSFFLIWIATYFIFYLWWLPDPKFFLLFLFPFLALGLITLSEIMGKLTKPTTTHRFFIILICIFVAIAINNFRGYIDLHKLKSHAYQEARALNMLAPKECTIIAASSTLAHLQYHFGRDKIISHNPLFRACYYKDIHFWNVKKERYAIMSLPDIVPERRYYSYSGYSHPSEWLEFIAWIFEFEYDTKSMLIGCREFKIMTDARRNLYIFLLPARMEVNGLENMFRILDDQINAYDGKQENIFQSWFSAFHQTL